MLDRAAVPGDDLPQAGRGDDVPRVQRSQVGDSSGLSLAAAPIPDLVARDFTADAPGTKMVADLKCRRRHLMSATHSRFGAVAVKSRSTRSGAAGQQLPGSVSGVKGGRRDRSGP
jgi:hypothetical protein